MNVLILTGKFGMGHISAANSLKEQILGKYPEHSVCIEDIIDCAFPEQAEMLYKSFAFMAKKGSLLYNSIYRHSAENGCMEPPLLYGYLIRRLERILKQRQPDVIFSTLPLCSQVLAKYKRKYQVSWKLVTCITDISSHGEWINGEVDFYMAAAEPVQQELIRKGVPEEKITVCGIPVRAEFGNQAKPPGTSLRRKILVMGGGLGLLPESEEFYRGLNQMTGKEFIVVTGKNKHLFNTIEGKYDNITVLGYTDQVPALMKEADAVLTKPGGITVFEAIAAQTPLLLFAPFLEQEKTNAAFVELIQAGCVLKKEERDMLRQLTELLQDDKTIKKYSENMKSFRESLDQQAVDRILAEADAARQKDVAGCKAGAKTRRQGVSA